MGCRNAGYAFGHNDSRFFESSHLIRIIRHQAHARNRQMPKDCARQRVIPQIALEPELFVRLHRIGAAVLQFIGAQFVHQPDPPAFLELVDDEPAPLGGNFAEGDFELGPAIASQAMENVSGQALRMDAQQRRRPIVHVAHLQDYGFLDARLRRARGGGRAAFKTANPK